MPYSATLSSNRVKPSHGSRLLRLVDKYLAITTNQVKLLRCWTHWDHLRLEGSKFGFFVPAMCGILSGPFESS